MTDTFCDDITHYDAATYPAEDGTQLCNICNKAIPKHSIRFGCK